MRRLSRYIFREVLTPGLIALVALTFIVSTRKIGMLIDIIIRTSPTPGEIWAVVASILPTVLTVTVPMGLLMGILTGFGRMSSDSEVIAMRASGIPMRQVLQPVLAVATLAWLATMALSVWVAPRTTANLKTLKAELALKYPTIAVQPRVFYEDQKSQYALYLNEAGSGDVIAARGILLVDLKKPGYPEFTLAESGILTIVDSNRSFQLALTNSSHHAISEEDPSRYEFSSAAASTITRPRPLDDQSPKASIEELPTVTLWERMRDGTATLEETTQFHQRLALPFACFAFALMGLPLGVSTKRGGRSTGLVLSVILMFAYYLTLVGGTRITATGRISPILGAWLPNVAFCIFGAILLARSDRRSENRIMAGVIQVAEWITGKFGAVKARKPDISGWAYTVGSRIRLFRLLDAYVLRGFWFFFAIVLGVFSSLFIVVTLFELLPDIIQNKISAAIVVIYFLFLMPQIVYWVAPLAVLLAVLINLGTLTKTNEVLAVKAGAVSLYRLSLPLLMVAVLLSGLVYVLQDYVLPTTNRKQDEYHNIIKGRAPQTYRDPSRKLMMGSRDQLYHYEFFDFKSTTFGNLSILNIDPKTYQVRERVFAKRATWNGEAWTLENGWLRRFSEDHRAPDEEFFERIPAFPMDSPAYFKREVRAADQMNYAELRRYVEDQRVSGVDVAGLTVDLYRKISYPMVSFIMALIGIPFSFKTGRKGAFYGIGLCLGLGIIYWSTFELFGKLGAISELSPLVAAWIPNLIFGASGFWMTLRLKT